MLAEDVAPNRFFLARQALLQLMTRLEGDRFALVAFEACTDNPVAIADRETGAVHFFYCLEYMRCFYMRSDDDGHTWSWPEVLMDGPIDDRDAALQTVEDSVALARLEGLEAHARAAERRLG